MRTIEDIKACFDTSLPVDEELCLFNPIKDICAVDPTGFVDLKAANNASSIPPIDGLTEERFNGIDDPNSIAGRPSDVFEAMQANKAIAGYQAPSSSSETHEVE